MSRPGLAALVDGRVVTGLGAVDGPGDVPLDVDAIRVLEEALPARFGGGRGGYQLAEEQEDDGTTRLALPVQPAVGVVDDQAVADVRRLVDIVPVLGLTAPASLQYCKAKDAE